jgi:hypothetical protein
LPWAALDDGFHEDPRLLDAGLTASGLFARATTYCARHLTDGRISCRALGRLLDDDDVAPVDALLSVGLLRPFEGGYEVVDYLVSNPSREQVAERKAKKRVAAEKRWSKTATATSPKAPKDDPNVPF